MSVFNHTIFHNSIKLIENQLKEHGIEKDESMFENNLIKKLLDHDWSLLEALKAGYTVAMIEIINAKKKINII